MATENQHSHLNKKVALADVKIYAKFFEPCTYQGLKITKARIRTYEPKIWSLCSNTAKNYKTSTSGSVTQYGTFQKPWWQGWPGKKS